MIYPIIFDLFYSLIGKIVYDDKNLRKKDAERHILFKQKIGIIYNSKYNISAGGIENLHPFDSQKYGRIYNQLKKDNIISHENQIWKPVKCPRSILQKVNLLIYFILS